MPLEKIADQDPEPEEGQGKKDKGPHRDGEIRLPEPLVDPCRQAGPRKDPVEEGHFAQQFIFQEIGEALVLETASFKKG